MSECLDLSTDWSLGWQPEPRMNRWRERYGDWCVAEGALQGTTWEWGQVFAGLEPEGDYRFEATLRLLAETTSGGVVFNFNEERACCHILELKPGQPARVDYILSDGFDQTVVPAAGEAIAAQRDYRIAIERRGDVCTIWIDEAELGQFSIAHFSGRMLGFIMRGGPLRVQAVRIADGAGTELFADDFSEDSMPRRVPVELDELTPERWIPAVVPGTVQTSLLEAGEIPDPYWGYNGPKQKWVDSQRWIYRKRFTLPAGGESRQLVLAFDGIDYHGYVWFNGQLLGYHEGMQRAAYFDVSALARHGGENEIVVCILPCPTPPHANVKPFILQRWHFNTDILTIGLWQGVKLYCYENVRIRHPYVRTLAIEEGGAARVAVSVELENNALWPFDLLLRFTITPPQPGREPLVFEHSTGYFSGTSLFDHEFTIEDAALWWPLGHGEQPLYTLTVEAEVRQMHMGNAVTGSDRTTCRFGVRTLGMRWTPDRKGLYPWILEVNGRSVFGKGMNWMPIDQMLRLEPARYRAQLQMAASANINLLRPWGAGPIETDDFFDVCDELGIMVWQEFPLANGYFHRFDREVWRETIRQNVLRLRNRASLVVWCGGNEFDPDCPPNRPIVDELAHLCATLDPDRAFHRASPHGGDSHSYRVNWMGGENYTRFTRDVSVAITEFSMASPIGMESLRKIIPAEELETWPPAGPDPLEAFDLEGWDPSFRLRESAFSMHDAHLSRAIMVMMPFMSEMGVPRDWDGFIRYNQAAHGALMHFGIDVWRSRWPFCTMTMGWVFNVLWPSSMTWDILDWYGLPKQPYFDIKRAYEPLHIGVLYDEMFTPAGRPLRMRPFVVSELRESIPDARIALRLYDAQFRLLADRTAQRVIGADAVTPLEEFVYPIPANAADQVMFLVADLRDESGALRSRSVYLPRVGASVARMPFLKEGPWVSQVAEHPTALRLAIEQDWAPQADGRQGCLVMVENTGPVPAYAVTLADAEDNTYVDYEDNYFWLEPGESRRLTILAPTPRTRLGVSAWNAR